jgi:hypothetical protein
VKNTNQWRFAMKDSQRIRIGRYESWMEDGSLRLQSHEFGRSGGFATSMDASETQKLLDLLMQNRRVIEDAAQMNEATHTHQARKSEWLNSTGH